MSNSLYPIGLIESQKVTPANSVVSDTFENGGTMSRLQWPAQNFKRRFALTHSSLTLAEWRYLRSFYSQRSGNYDSFWYRDNINRRGNANVRFSAALVEQQDGVLFNATPQLDEIAAVRALPEWDELTAAAGTAPLFWYDANREFYLSHLGAILTEPAIYDAANQVYPAMWQSGGTNLTGAGAQYQAYNLQAAWARTAANIAGLATGQPACTLFLIHQFTGGTILEPMPQVLCAMGGVGTNAGLGLQFDYNTGYRPWIGSAGTWTNAYQPFAFNTWTSLAVVWPGGSNNGSLYANAALIGTDTNTRAYAVGPASVGAAPDGSLTNGASDSSNNLAHVMAFAGALSLAQIKAVHNLVGYQYGLAVVV
jgi:hypothetical protein